MNYSDVLASEMRAKKAHTKRVLKRIIKQARGKSKVFIGKSSQEAKQYVAAYNLGVQEVISIIEKEISIKKSNKSAYIPIMVDDKNKKIISQSEKLRNDLRKWQESKKPSICGG